MEWFYGAKLLSSSGLQKMDSIGYMPFLYTLFAALITSLLITHLYLRFYGSKAVGSTIYRAFPMLGVAITAIFVSLQFSIPLSLGLLGALSIVRFRTPIKDPEEVGFILLIIATSICCATFNLIFLAMVILIALLGLIILNKDKKFFKKNVAEGILIINLNKLDYDQHSDSILNDLKKNIAGKLDSILENENDAAISFSFSSIDEQKFQNFKSILKGYSQGIRINLYFNSPGEF